MDSIDAHQQLELLKAQLAQEKQNRIKAEKEVKELEHRIETERKSLTSFKSAHRATVSFNKLQQQTLLDMQGNDDGI